MTAPSRPLGSASLPASPPAIESHVRWNRAAHPEDRDVCRAYLAEYLGIDPALVDAAMAKEWPEVGT